MTAHFSELVQEIYKTTKQYLIFKISTLCPKFTKSYERYKEIEKYKATQEEKKKKQPVETVHEEIQIFGFIRMSLNRLE